VAASLEKRWEEALHHDRQTQDDYVRFQRELPAQVSATERARIEALAADLPALWHAPATTNVDRKQILRCLIDRVVVHVRCDSELVPVTIQWAGGDSSSHELLRPVATYAQLRNFEHLMDRVVTLRTAGQTAAQIAIQLNAEGFSPPKRRGEFTPPVVYQLLKRRGLMGDERAHDELLTPHEWWLTDLARALQMSHMKLREWVVRGWVQGRKSPIKGLWIVWADPDEVTRLHKVLAQSRRGVTGYPAALTTPKARPSQPVGERS
jgi:hypothetical protein